MTIGTAIVIVMCLYLLDKHGLLKRAVGIMGILAAISLLWIFGQQQYRKWQSARYIRHQAEMQSNLIHKYHGAIIVPAIQWDDEQRKPTGYSVPLDELELQKPQTKAAATNIPKLNPSEVEFEDTSKVIYLNDICKEPQWGEMNNWERNAVVEAIMPKMDIFDRMQFVDRCH